MKERKHLRLINWDYSKEGVYCVTICCHDNQKLFGSICNGQITLSAIGEISSQYWSEIPLHFPHVKLDEFVVMPNHIHGLIILDYSLIGSRHGVTLQSKFSRPTKNSVSVIVNQYKSSVKRWCNKNGHCDFQWQSRFYDQIIKNEIAIDNIREYIQNNPRNWTEDDLNL
jgi:putative transposase